MCMWNVSSGFKRSVPGESVTITMPAFSVPVVDLISSCVTIKRGRVGGRVIIKQAMVERFLKDRFVTHIDRKATIGILNLKSIIVMLRKFTKSAVKGTSQKRAMLKKATTRNPIKVQYCLVENSAKAFVRELQKTIYDLENQLAIMKQKKEEKKRAEKKLAKKSSRTVRRLKKSTLDHL